MMNIKKHLRDIPTSILIIIGLAVCCFIIINSADIAMKIHNEQKRLNFYPYTVNCLIDIQHSNEKLKDRNAYLYSMLDEYLSSLECESTSISNVHIYINQKLNNFNCEVILTHQRELNLYTMKEERIVYDVKNEGTGKCLYLGETIAESLSDTNGVFSVNKCEFYSIDTLQNNMSGGIDNTIYVIWDYCNEQQKEVLAKAIQENTNTIFFNLMSYDTLEDTYNKFSQDMNAIYGCKVSVFDALYTGDYQNAWYQVYSTAFIIISLVFSVLSCFVISDIWLTRRKKEIAIRKAFGYNKFQLFQLLLGDIGKLSALSWVLALSMEILYKIIFKDLVVFDVDFWQISLMIVIGMLVIILLIVERMMVQIQHISPVEWIRREV